MREAEYYRQQAARARRLAREVAVSHLEVAAHLAAVAKDYEDIATDLELGAIEIRHPELMPQLHGNSG